MTRVLKTPEGTMTLKPVQAKALHDIGTKRGMGGIIPVGKGKTIISLLAPYVLEAKRPLLLTKAALIDKTERDRRELMRHWRIPRNIRLQSYEGLGRVAAARLLDLYRPDLIIADEAQCLKNLRGAAGARRVKRYMQQYPDTQVIVMSGTLIKHSLHDFAHLLEWALGDESPAPIEEDTVNEWADLLDERGNPLRRPDPGVLGGSVGDAQTWFRDRLLQTEGIVSTDLDAVGASILLRGIEYEVNETTKANFAQLRNTWTQPCGWALSQAVDVWRTARELALGLHYVWDPRPPREWLEARKAWAKFVRDQIVAHSRGENALDSELMVVNHIDKTEHVTEAVREGRALLAEWRRISPTFTINSVPRWHDDSALNVCSDWMHKHKGIVWCRHTFFAQELERRMGRGCYYGPGGLNCREQSIMDEDASRPIIASVAACSAGFNLQRFHENLITSCFTAADEAEQLIGRTHRDGQEADTVEVDILVGCAEHWDGFDGAMSRARMTNQMLGQSQKLLLADVSWPEKRMDGARWVRST